MSNKSQTSKLTFRCGTVEIGDIFRSSWGYEQTNITFYQVVSLHGKKTISVKEIASETIYTGYMQGNKKPVPNKFTSDITIKRRVYDCSDKPIINIKSYMTARKTSKDKVHEFTAYG